jgi:hypothetical protein
VLTNPAVNVAIAAGPSDVVDKIDLPPLSQIQSVQASRDSLKGGNTDWTTEVTSQDRGNVPGTQISDNLLRLCETGRLAVIRDMLVKAHLISPHRL